MERIFSAIEDLWDKLAPFGLEHDLATVYAALWVEGRCKPTRITHRTGLSKPRTYRALESLVHLGFAKKSLQRPLQFDAVAPEIVMSLMRSALQEKDRELARVEQDFNRRMRSLRDGVALQDAQPSFSVVQGREAVINRFAQVASQATSSLDMLGSHRNPAIFERAHRVVETLVDRAKAGVQVRLLIDGAATKQVVKALANVKGLSIRHKRMDGIAGLLIVDSAKTVQLALADPTGRMHSKSSVAIVAEAPLMAAGLRALFDDAWAHATDAADGQ